ncbi:unnamed protein product [Durusdinium trenchii]|uniref:Uncharacterized protein n=1 Tax=Durusdinium trenchii TaxID=1381693 RepID=A0ABP0IMR1_9DINO
MMEASANRIWFAYVADYKSVPAYLKDRMELQLGGYGVGYRGMCRFRSGPIFVQPVMKGFDYAWTLDTDGYFPADLHSDPLERMLQTGRSTAIHMCQETRLLLSSISGSSVACTLSPKASMQRLRR